MVTFIAGECIGFYTAFQNSAICISFDFELIHCNCQMLPLLFLFVLFVCLFALFLTLFRPGGALEALPNFKVK